MQGVGDEIGTDARTGRTKEVTPRNHWGFAAAEFGLGCYGLRCIALTISIADSFNRQQPGKSSQNLADESCTQIDLSLRFAVANFEKTSTPQY